MIPPPTNSRLSRFIHPLSSQSRDHFSPILTQKALDVTCRQIQGRTSLEAALDRESAQRDRISSLEARVKELEEERVELKRSLDKKTKMHESTLELMHEMQVQIDSFDHLPTCTEIFDTHTS